MKTVNPLTKTFKSLVLAAGLLVTSLSFANVAVEVDENNVILAGHDAVSYFTEDAAVEGYAGISTVYNGAIYHFSSEENRDLFKANPSKYAPQYGGFCAFGTSIGKKFDISGKAFEVVDGKLYVQKNLAVLDTWTKEKVERIEQSEANWPKIKDVEASKL